MKSVAVAVLLLLGSCAVARIPEPTLEAAGGSAEVLGGLREGRTLYVDKCSGCHSLYSVDELSDKDWLAATEEMVQLRKVTLTGAQRSALERYLTTVNERD